MREALELSIADVSRDSFHLPFTRRTLFVLTTDPRTGTRSFRLVAR
jgi:hypothetical protein